METIVIMIIAGIVSMIFRKNKNNSRQTRRNPSGKPLGEIQTLFKEITDNITTETKPLRTENKPKLQSSLNLLEAEYEQVRQESQASRIGMAAARNQPANRDFIKNQEEVTPDLTLNPDQRTVIDGIIWSEILGDPRSKNPYKMKQRSR
ncbi:hypothetical protein L1999_21895 [Neobacillus drentensis]|uniref:hypothetical protein n=1 Tax=Neobacillus drentensis TaxID=220684 RepID=UPI001F2C18A6|nr:hypothetical protein [Neobacillus drentensis]ULT55717.1 hypothetical protein L1999_21895 [Neobacillus drentensis]